MVNVTNARRLAGDAPLEPRQGNPGFLEHVEIDDTAIGLTSVPLRAVRQALSRVDRTCSIIKGIQSSLAKYTILRLLSVWKYQC
jgi:hypothetical protein